MRPTLLTIAALLAGVATASAAPVGTEFTYQGQLLKNGSPFTGNADGVFRLYDAENGGTQVGSSITITAFNVSGGLFTVSLDFGSVFTANVLWLDVQVRTPPDPSYTLLTPRQRLSAVPVAMYALGGTGGLTLPFAGSVSAPGQDALEIHNTSLLSGRGVFGEGNIGVWGRSPDFENTPHPVPSQVGVYGEGGDSGTGVYGVGGPYGYGVYGAGSDGSSPGVFGTSGIGGSGVKGIAGGQYGHGVSGEAGNFDFGVGVYGYANYGIYHTTPNYAVYGDNPSNAPNNWAGYFPGQVWIYNLFTPGASGPMIDHPLDPENTVLRHSWVASSEMKTIYDGNVVLDASGEAQVEMPTWFEALNRDFRYQLTAIGAPAPGLHVAEKISQRRFRIAGGAPGMEVSWQVTGIRQDATATANPIQTESSKVAHDRGRYLDPKAFGLTEDRGVDYEVRMKARAAAAAVRAGTRAK